MTFQSSTSDSPYNHSKYLDAYDKNITLRKEEDYMRAYNEQAGLQSTVTTQIKNERHQISNLLLQIQEKEQEARRWKERALKVESGFKEVQKLLQGTDDMRMILEDKIVEVEHLQTINDTLNNDNQVLRNNCKNHQNELLQQQQQMEQRFNSKISTNQPKQDPAQYSTKIDTLQNEVYDLTLVVENFGKQLREKDLSLKKLELSQVEKDNLLRQFKRDLEISSKKQIQREGDLKIEFQRTLDEQESNITKDFEELNRERALYKERMADLEQNLQDGLKYTDVVKQKVVQLERDNQGLKKEIQQLHQNQDQLNHNLQDNQQLFSQNNISQKTKYGQDIETQRYNYENHINKINADLQQLEQIVHTCQDQIVQKNLQIESLVSNLNNLTKENQLLQGEYELNREKNIELQKQRQLELELQDGMFNERIDHMITKYSNQIKYLDAQINTIRQAHDKKVKENEELQISSSEALMKLNDIQKSQQYLVNENENLRSTLFSVQKQKEWEDTEKEEQKKKDLSLLKRYHETLLDQLGRENNGIRQVLEEKNKECEEWRSECLRLKQYQK